MERPPALRSEAVDAPSRAITPAADCRPLKAARQMPHPRQSGERILSRGAALVHRLSKPVGTILVLPQLRHACRLAGTPDYTPHAFRRAWATGAAAVLLCWEVVLGGGWRREYNQIRPHRALGYRPPAPETQQPRERPMTLVPAIGLT